MQEYLWLCGYVLPNDILFRLFNSLDRLHQDMIFLFNEEMKYQKIENMISLLRKQKNKIS